jgi:hypothetical protein
MAVFITDFEKLSTGFRKSLKIPDDLSGCASFTGSKFY